MKTKPTDSERLSREQEVSILAWGFAFAYADENPQGLIDGTMTSEEAASRMKKLDAAEKDLFEIPVDVSPDPLNRWRVARETPGCVSCWISSRRPKNHPECEIKITEWLDAREALLEWISDGFVPTKELPNV